MTIPGMIDTLVALRNAAIGSDLAVETLEAVVAGLDAAERALTTMPTRLVPRVPPAPEPQVGPPEPPVTGKPRPWG